jgi:pimeloyl-ACP methyl ester carboxylesterase
MVDETLPSPTPRTVGLPDRGPGLMAYLDFGRDDRPVDAVFLHANGFNALTYRHVLAPLATRYRILAVDQRGHGRTNLETVVEGRRDWLDLRDDLLAYLDTLDLSHVVLAGHSMGATTSLLAAAAEPLCCRRLVLFDPVMPAPRSKSAPAEPGLTESARRRRAVFQSRADALASYRGRGAFRTWPDSMLLDYVEAGFWDLQDGTVSLACAPVWEASGYVAQEHDSREALNRCSCPVDIVRAETASTFQLTGGLEKLGDRVRVTTVPGASHFLPMERPDIVRMALTDAIEGPVPAGAKTSVPV